MKFDIFVDSSANLTEEMIAKSNIKVIPYVCTCDGEQVICYTNGIPFSQAAHKFYSAMERGADVSTSLISSERIAAAFEPSLKEGKDVLMITISSQVSGTNHQAELAAQELMEKYPERRVYIADSANSGFGEGLLAVQAARLRGLGEDAYTCYKWLEGNKFRLNSYFTVADLKYLKKGGRISSAVAIAGTLLNIKPILKADGNGKFLCAERCAAERSRLPSLPNAIRNMRCSPRGTPWR